MSLNKPTLLDHAKAAANGWSMHFQAQLTDKDVDTLAGIILAAKIEELEEMIPELCGLCGDTDEYGEAVWIGSLRAWRHSSGGEDPGFPCEAHPARQRIKLLEAARA